MAKYATFDLHGLPTAFYATDVHGDLMRQIYGDPDPDTGVRPVAGSEPNPGCSIPADAIFISDQQWQEFISNQGTRRWAGSGVVIYAPPESALTLGDVNAERDRRIVVGRVIGGVQVTGRDQDARNLMSLALIAQMRIAAGDTTTPTTFRDGDNVDHDLTPTQMLTMWQESAAYVSALYEASWGIKAMVPIPLEFTDDSYWP